MSLLIANHGIIVSAGGSGFDADYQAILDRGTALGYTLPSAAQQIKQNALILALKSAGVWTLLDILYIFANDGGQDFATLNWKAPSSFQCLRILSPTFTSNVGFKPNGSTQYLNTQWTPSSNGVNYTQNNCGAGMYINDEIGNNQVSFGAAGGGNTLEFLPRTAGNSCFYWINETAGGSNGAGTSIGFWHIKRTASNAKGLFRNGSSQGTTPQASTGLPTVPIFLGCINSGGIPATFRSNQFGSFFTGASLNGLESSFYTAWNNYFTSL